MRGVEKSSVSSIWEERWPSRGQPVVTTNAQEGIAKTIFQIRHDSAIYMIYRITSRWIVENYQKYNYYGRVHIQETSELSMDGYYGIGREPCHFWVFFTVDSFVVR